MGAPDRARLLVGEAPGNVAAWGVFGTAGQVRDAVTEPAPSVVASAVRPARRFVHKLWTTMWTAIGWPASEVQG